MDDIFNQFGEWLKTMIIPTIMSNLSSTFDAVNTQVGEVGAQVALTPANFEPGVFSLIRTVNGKYFPANSAINFQQISAVKNQQFIMPHISRGVSPGSVIYSNGRLTS